MSEASPDLAQIGITTKEQKPSTCFGELPFDVLLTGLGSYSKHRADGGYMAFAAPRRFWLGFQQPSGK